MVMTPSAMRLLCAGLGTILIAPVAWADSVSYSFSNRTNNYLDLSSQFKMTASDDGVGAGQVGLLFENFLGGSSASIANIYFEDGTVFSSFHSMTHGGGVEFGHDAGAPHDPPGINDFDSTQSFSVNADNPKPENGINPGEWLRVVFNLQTGIDFNEIISALANGLLKTNGDPGYNSQVPSLRVAFHVIDLPLGESDSYMSEGPQNIPLPAPLGLGLAGLAGVFVMARKCRRSAAAPL